MNQPQLKPHDRVRIIKGCASMPVDHAALIGLAGEVRSIRNGLLIVVTADGRAGAFLRDELVKV